MTDHKLSINDSQDTADSAGTGETPVEPKQYKVLCESGLFQEGRQYNAGSIVHLHPEVGQRFLELGDVEEVKDEE